MTSAEELTKLETFYSAWLDAGMPETYSIDGRTVTRPAMESIVKRIDTLRAAVANQTRGSFYASQFRDPE